MYTQGNLDRCGSVWYLEFIMFLLVGNLIEFQPVRNKNRENTRQSKQSNTQDNIYVVRQFSYVHRVAGISLLSGKKKIQDEATIILHNKNTATKPTIKNPHQSRFSIIQKTLTCPWALRLGLPLLHGLSLSKSPIKNHAILFGLSRVVEPDQTKLGSTKPNKSPTWRLVQSPTSTAILQKHNPLIPATHPPVLKLEDQLELYTASTSQ